MPYLGLCFGSHETVHHSVSLAAALLSGSQGQLPSLHSCWQNSVPVGYRTEASAAKGHLQLPTTQRCP